MCIDYKPRESALFKHIIEHVKLEDIPEFCFRLERQGGFNWDTEDGYHARIPAKGKDVYELVKEYVGTTESLRTPPSLWYWVGVNGPRQQLIRALREYVEANKPQPKHKHAEVIKAWADGAEIQVRCSPSEVWRDIDPTRPITWNVTYEYRIKPKLKRTNKYRRYIWELPSGKPVLCAISETKWSGSDIEGTEAGQGFIKWIDTEWQYHEYEE
jgi:hypothetical protein